MKRSKSTGEKFFIVLDDKQGSLRDARGKLPDWQCVQGDASLAAQYGVKAPAIVVVNGGRATVARDVKAGELLRSGRRLLPPNRFRPMARQQPGDGVDSRGTRNCPSGDCPPATTPTPPPPRGRGVSTGPKRVDVKPRPSTADKKAARELNQDAQKKGKKAAGDCQGKGCQKKKGFFDIFGDIFGKIGEVFSGAKA